MAIAPNTSHFRTRLANGNDHCLETASVEHSGLPPEEQKRADVAVGPVSRTHGMRNEMTIFINERAKRMMDEMIFHRSDRSVLTAMENNIIEGIS
jgi:hypothetical protein